MIISVNQPFPPTAVRRRHTQTVRDGSSSYKICYVIVIKNFLNPDRHQNPIRRSKVTTILLKGWICPIGEVACGRVCSCSMRSRLVSMYFHPQCSDRVQCYLRWFLHTVERLYFLLKTNNLTIIKKCWKKESLQHGITTKRHCKLLVLFGYFFFLLIFPISQVFHQKVFVCFLFFLLLFFCFFFFFSFVFSSSNSCFTSTHKTQKLATNILLSI